MGTLHQLPISDNGSTKSSWICVERCAAVLIGNPSARGVRFGLALGSAIDRVNWPSAPGIHGS